MVNYEADREKQITRRRAQYYTNHEHSLKQARDFYNANKEHCKEYARQYRNTQTANQPDIVYVITHPLYPEYSKVGRTVNPKARLAQYNTSDPLRRYAYHTQQETEDANALEKAVHTALVGFRVGNTEWFAIHPDDAASILLSTANPERGS